MSNILELIEKTYNLEQHTLAESVFSPSLLKSVCVERPDDDLDGSKFYMTIVPRQTDKENTSFTIFKQKKDCFHCSKFYYAHRERDDEYSVIKENVEEFKPVKIVIETTSYSGKFYINKLRKEYPHIEVISIEITEVSRKEMITKLKTYFENKKIFLYFQEYLSLFENEKGYIPSPYVGCVLSVAFLTELI